MESTKDFRSRNEFWRVRTGKVAEVRLVMLDFCFLVTVARLYSSMDLKILILYFSSDILPYILHVSEVVGHTEGCQDSEKPESFDGKGRVGQVSPTMETGPATEFPHCHVHCKITK